MSAFCHPAAYDAFASELPQLETTPGLFRAAFAIARHEHPYAEVSLAERTIDDLADTVRKRVHSESIDARLAHLHDVLFEVVGFVGNVDDYYNPANSYLPEVLRTHRGLPITLVLIYKCVAERIGLTVSGINSPGHFLAAVSAADDNRDPASDSAARMYVDPFYGGELLNNADVSRRIADSTGIVVDNSNELLKVATHRQWLTRMLNNLLAVFAHTGHERNLYAMQELQQLLT